MIDDLCSLTIHDQLPLVQHISLEMTSCTTVALFFKISRYHNVGPLVPTFQG